MQTVAQRYHEHQRSKYEDIQYYATTKIKNRLIHDLGLPVDSHKSVGRAVHHNFQLAVILGANRYAAGHHTVGAAGAAEQIERLQ
jgi:hypothetical protein